MMCVTEKPSRYGFWAASASAASATGAAAGVAATIERAEATKSEILACVKAGVAGGKPDARETLPAPFSTPVDPVPAFARSACCSREASAAGTPSSSIESSQWAGALAIERSRRSMASAAAAA